MKKTILIGMLILLFIPLALAESPKDIKLDQFVEDYANVLDDNQELEINDLLKSFQETGTAEFAVVTINSLDGQDIESFAFELANGVLGDKEKNNGLLLLIATKDEQYRIEVGRGIEPVLNDAKVGRIARNFLVPNLENGSYYNGILSTVSEINKVFGNDASYSDLDDEQINEEEASHSYIFYIIIIIIFIILMIITKGEIIFLILPFVKGGNKGFGGGSFGGGGAKGKF